MNYTYFKFGRPSWQLLVKAVETVDYERAKQIARNHPKASFVVPHVCELALLWTILLARCYLIGCV